nr:MAG TPA: hypothetical protein [Caudoviricetes sp.]
MLIFKELACIWALKCIISNDFLIHAMFMKLLNKIICSARYF